MKKGRLLRPKSLEPAATLFSQRAKIIVNRSKRPRIVIAHFMTTLYYRPLVVACRCVSSLGSVKGSGFTSFLVTNHQVVTAQQSVKESHISHPPSVRYMYFT